MIISSSDGQSSDNKLLVSLPSGPTATTSTEPTPPSFEAAAATEQAHLSIDFAPNEPPPPFGEYQADFFTTRNGDIVSHDNHLNTDGEALYRFLLKHSSTIPHVLIHIRGCHTESRHVTVRDADGKTRTHHESHTVVDFDFNIEIGQHIQPPLVQFTVPDDIPAFRGRMFKQIEASDGSGPRKPNASERKAYKKWIKERDEKGLPPWQSWSVTPNNADFLRSSKTLRTWADEYCASELMLKEFSYEKVVYGWNMQRLQDSVRATIKTTFYSGDVDVDIVKRASMINIRPNNLLSTALSKTWFKILTIIFLVYPFIWLFKRFHSKGGGRWQVGGGAYALMHWVPVGPERQAELLAGGPRNEGAFSQRSDGTILKAVGISESEWIRLWRRTIIQAVQSRYQSTVALSLPTVVEESL